MASKITYSPLTSAPIKNNRILVISQCSKGGYTIAQQMKVDDGDGKKITVFLKGAIQVEDVNGLYNLRDALNGALEIIEKN